MTTNAQIVTAAQMGREAQTTTGNMSTLFYVRSIGSLPRAWERLLIERRNLGAITQVIYSYSTPIAWFDTEHGWIVPQVRYSITTSSKHQTHLYRLGGRHIYLPWDATEDDARRVLSGELIFSNGRTYPGPNYKAA